MLNIIWHFYAPFVLLAIGILKVDCWLTRKVYGDNEISEELQARRKAEKEHGHTHHSASEKDGAGATQEREKAVLPIPVKQVDGVDVKEWTVKQWLQKINEELDELKADVLSAFFALEVVPNDRPDLKNSEHDRMPKIAEEACDTITAITSMLEAMGIDEQQRQAAQKLVNEHNRERNRL